MNSSWLLASLLLLFWLLVKEKTDADFSVNLLSIVCCINSNIPNLRNSSVTMTTTGGPNSDCNNMREVKFALDKTIYIEAETFRLAKEDINSTYYTRDELRKIKDEANGPKGQNRSDDFWFRGAESTERVHAKRRVSLRSRARSSVLEEQARQKEAQIFDMDMLSEVYKGFSLASTSKARRTAQTDAAMVRTMYISSVGSMKDDDDTASTASMDSFSMAGML